MDLEQTERLPTEALIAIEASEAARSDEIAMDCEPLTATLEPTHRLALLGQLVAGFAHDFRALLLPLAGYARALREELPDAHPAQQRLQAMLRAAEMGGELVDQVLAAARDRAVPSRRLSLGEAVRTALPLLRLALPGGVELRMAVDPGAPEVLANEVQLQRILLNLVVNAARAIRARHGVIEIGVVALLGDEPGAGAGGRKSRRACDHVRLTVADNGMGMDVGTLRRVRERLADPDATRAHGGLGLTIVQDIVRAHGGRLSIESHEGAGTSVRIDLPSADASSKPAAPRTLATDPQP